MSSSQDLNKPHKTRIENCRGTLLDPRDSYQKWAYWWPSLKGWRNVPAPKQEA